MKEVSFIIQAAILVGMLTSCGTTKKIVFISDPSNALVINHNKTSLDSAKYIEMYKPSPSTQNVLFSNKKDTLNISYEKRGYHAVTKKICRYTDTVSVKLERITEIPEKSFTKAVLQKAKLILIGADVEVIIHSGVGAFEKYKKSDEKTKAITDKFYDEYRKQTPSNMQIEVLNSKNDSIRQRNRELINSMRDYVLTLDEHRLDFLSYTPLITNKIKDFQHFMNSIRQDSSENTYFLYIWAKCISVTTGRIIGSVLVAAGAGVVNGYNAATGNYYAYNFSPLSDRAVFDSGTLLEFYVIDPKTSEVLSIDHAFYGNDITGDEPLKKLVSKVIKYPELEK